MQALYGAANVIRIDPILAGRPLRWLVSIMGVLLSFSVPQTSEAKYSPPFDTIAPMLEQVLPAVVNISTLTRFKVRRNPLLDDPFFRQFFDLPEDQPQEGERSSLGSGIIVDADKGYVLTNDHVIKGADEITVTLRDRRHFKAKVVGSDPGVDLALLHINASGLTALPLANSDDLRVGDFVVAIGSPFGLGQTVTFGIVSALGRTGLGIEGYENFIQTDASINPGNSGGPLVNMHGELVGINTAIVGPSGANIGIGFAIPSNMARATMQSLEEYGNVRRGELGVAVQSLTPELAQAFGLHAHGGAVIAKVMPGSAADKAGLQPGDVIVALNGEEVSNSNDLRNDVALLRVGTEIRLDILRHDVPMTVHAVIAEPHITTTNAGSLSKRLAGAMLGRIKDTNPLAGRVEGVEVLQVEHDSPAWAAGLRSGDIIIAVNQISVATVADVMAAIKHDTNGLVLNLIRGDSELMIVVQ
jgi:Do/DeqQ family serine protease